jgi:uncharacterized membrane protein
MAGIGFALRTLSRQETLSGVARASGHAAVIAAGPWLFTVFSLAAITALTERIAGHDILASFRAVVIYAFATSLVFAAPITIVATRLVADRLWLKKVGQVRGLLIAGYAYAAAAAGVGVILLALYFRVPAPLAISLYACSSLVAMIWVVLAFCGAVRDYGGITVSFVAGLVVAVAGATAAAFLGLKAEGMVWGFASGLALTFASLTRRALETFPGRLDRPFDSMKEIARSLSIYGDLALGATLGTAGVWVDKWVFWFSREGQSVDGGLIHAPLYDSAMFIASLVIIPALAQFVVKLETDFFERYQHYYGTIQSHGTIAQIEEARVRLAGFSLENLALITISQLALAAVLVLAAPAIVEVLNLQFRQISILRYGALGSVFLFVFIAATSMIVFFDRRRIYALLQGTFFLLNLTLSIVSVRLGEDYYGVGYFAATVIASALALVIADQTFTRLNYLTFIGNNPSVTGPRRHRFWQRFRMGGLSNMSR